MAETERTMLIRRHLGTEGLLPVTATDVTPYQKFDVTEGMSILLLELGDVFRAMCAVQRIPVMVSGDVTIIVLIYQLTLARRTYWSETLNN